MFFVDPVGPVCWGLGASVDLTCSSTSHRCSIGFGGPVDTLSSGFGFCGVSGHIVLLEVRCHRRVASPSMFGWLVHVTWRPQLTDLRDFCRTVAVSLVRLRKTSWLGFKSLLWLLGERQFQHGETGSLVVHGGFEPGTLLLVCSSPSVSLTAPPVHDGKVLLSHWRWNSGMKVLGLFNPTVRVQPPP